MIRGNSGSGKTTTAREVRRRYGRGCALLKQDYLRRIILREHDSSRINPVAPAFITTTARTALDLGYHVVLEGILHTDRYGAALHQLIDTHPGPTYAYYLDVSFDETVRSHRTRRSDSLRSRCATGTRTRTCSTFQASTSIGEVSTFEETVSTILHTSGLTVTAAQTPCPIRCGRCATDA